MTGSTSTARTSAKTTLKTLENSPNPRRTMEALREMGYDSYASILDLIDNSIDATASMVKVTVAQRGGDIVLEIQDDGYGMDEGILSEALRLGSDIERAENQLGKFGMGLVTASIGLSQRVEVVTKEEDGPALYGSFDLDEIAEEGKFVKRIGQAPPEEAARLPEGRGTLVRLSNTDRIDNKNTTTFASTLRKRIGQIHRKFLKSGLKVEVNGALVEAIDPLMLSHPDTQLVMETEIDVDGQEKAAIRVVDLPDLGQAGNSAHGIIPQNAGFYIVRNNREIMAAETFDFFRKHGDYSHFRAEVCFDGSRDAAFHTDVKKMSVHPSQSFMDKLRQATQSLITESSRRGRARANVARGDIDHSIAEANINRRSTLIPKPKSLVEKRTRRGGKGSHPQKNGERDRTPHVTDLKTISGLKVVFNEGNYGEENPFYQVQQKKRTITVTYNREHPFWRELIEHASSPKVVAVLDYLVFALANSELLVPEQAKVVKSQVNTTLVGLLV